MTRAPIRSSAYRARLDPYHKPTSHPCEAPGCAAWGAFGFGHGRAETQHWFCLAHRSLGEALL